MSAARCKRCGLPVKVGVTKTGQEIECKPEPDGTGQVLILDGRATFLHSKALDQARKAGLPIYTRHGVSCREFWNR